MHEYNLLEILAIGFSLALLFGYLARRLGLSPIVGYLLAGFFAGPYTPGFVADPEIAHQLSEAGVILLMFGVGLHFHLEDLLAVKRIAVPGALFQCATATVCGTLAAYMLGLTRADGLILGMGLSVASTVVLLRVLTDNNKLDSVDGHVAVGWLVVEDIITVVLLVLLPSLAVLISDTSGAVSLVPVAKAFGGALLRLALLWVLVLVVGGKVVPWVLTQVIRTRSEELFTLTVLVAAFATAVAAAVFFQASMALGAFLGGMVVGKTRISYQAGANILPLRDAFAVLFFLSVGMLFDPGFLLEHPLLVLAALGIVLLIKPLAAMLIVILLGYTPHTALVVGISLAQVGEFSFILAQQAESLGLISPNVYKILVVCALLSITLNPGLFRTIPRVERLLQRHGPLWAWLTRRADSRTAKLSAQNVTLHHDLSTPEARPPAAIIVGYGPAGKSVARALCGTGVEPVIVDMNVDTVNYLNEKKHIRAIFGDSSRRDVLVAAGIERAAYLIISLPVLAETATTALTAKTLNPELRVVARARFLQDKPLLEKAGVDAVATEEEEISHVLAGMVVADMRNNPPRGVDLDAGPACTL